MATSVTLTGTGVPHPSPGRAGPGVLVRTGDLSLQFDAGRGTVQRLAEAGLEQVCLTAVLVTHVHSDHVVDLADLAMTRWILQQLAETGPLPIVVPRGAPERFVEHMLDPFGDDIALRMAHVHADAPGLRVQSFDLPTGPTTVWSDPEGPTVVAAIGVHHEPVVEAVAYRVTSDDGVVVISGDTRVCQEVEELSRGADVLVHEACRASALRELVAGTRLEPVVSYQADTVALGGLVERAGVGHLVRTHLIPPPKTPDEEEAFADDVRAGGYTGRVTVGRDLLEFDV